MENRKVIVVGAGIGGLAAGYWLRQHGFVSRLFGGAMMEGAMISAADAVSKV